MFEGQTRGTRRGLAVRAASSASPISIRRNSPPKGGGCDLSTGSTPSITPRSQSQRSAPGYSTTRRLQHIPRIPLEGSLDLTYRCNLNCRHCWLRLPAGSPKKREELSLSELKSLIDDARSMGCGRWTLSGGEPLLRPDFSELFEYLTERSIVYTLNTNGTLITPAIAGLLKRRGHKMVAVYGATADVYDRVTRKPGSFDAAVRGMRYLREAGASFTVQIVPMRENYQQLDEMIAFAKSLSERWRIGADWLYLSAEGDAAKNAEIEAQRLSPDQVVDLDRPDLSRDLEMEQRGADPPQGAADDHLFAACIAARRQFHIDPYGGMSFCGFVKDPAMRYDLKQGNFQQCWDVFIPSLAARVRGGDEYSSACGSCGCRTDCRWCSVYGYLEHRRHGAKVSYLCDIARHKRSYLAEKRKTHRRYYGIGGMTIQVDSDLPIADDTFKSKFKKFEARGPGDDVIALRHHFSLPDLSQEDLGKEIYRKAPWIIYERPDSWIYLGISPPPYEDSIHRVAVFNKDHTRGRIYHPTDEVFRGGGLESLTLFATDQIVLARVLADRQGCYIHSSGLSVKGQGLLFVGHAGAGKSTMTAMLRARGEILCDDRMIVRREEEGFRTYGTWSHGVVPEVSANSAPLRAILFLEQARENKLIPVSDRGEIVRRLLACLIRPLATADWWEKTLPLVQQIASEVSCYRILFDKSGRIAEAVEELAGEAA